MTSQEGAPDPGQNQDLITQVPPELRAHPTAESNPTPDQPVIDSVPFDMPETTPRPNSEQVLYGGYTGVRPSQTPGARYETGMPVRLGAVEDPRPGEPRVPKLS